MNWPWESKTARREYVAEHEELLKKLQPYADAYGEELFHFMLRVHITDGDFGENLRHLRPRTIFNIKTFLKNAPAAASLTSERKVIDVV